MTVLPQIVAREPLPPDEAKWTKLVKVTYLDLVGTSRVWESAERTTRPAGSDIDGVDIVAVMRGRPAVDGLRVYEPEPSLASASASAPYLILEKQFRPAVGRTVIELPAGLVDPGETPAAAAVRELREETGFVGVPAATSLPMLADPGFGNSSLAIVHLDVDLADPANQHPIAALEDGELVQDVFCVPLARLYAACSALAADGYAIDSRVGTIAESFDMARRLLTPEAL